MIDVREFMGDHICMGIVGNTGGARCFCACDCCMGRCPGAEHPVSIYHASAFCSHLEVGEHKNPYPPATPVPTRPDPSDDPANDWPTVSADEGMGLRGVNAEPPVPWSITEVGGDDDEEIDGTGTPEVDDANDEGDEASGQRAPATPASETPAPDGGPASATPARRTAPISNAPPKGGKAS